ncbi:peptidase aspartic [Lecanosticta acicola]|uniref:Peptidase aspartic n=1 Tax=Lecanosticta acicola TaxID=111012 RepID=A0AAI9E9C3_9PEZI|nr:peptidase aspartic [Lecanosticta acicola]
MAASSSTFNFRHLLLLPTALLPLLAHALHVDANVLQLQPRADTTNTIPAPISISPDQNWDGIDGAWSTFTLRVGTPQQFVRTYISFAAYQTWVVLPEGCAAAAIQASCADSRGWLYNESASSTFDRMGIYDLWIEKNLGYNGNAIYGYDTVGLGGQGEQGPTLKNTTVGGLAVEDFWLGVFGLNPKPTNFTSFSDGSPSYMALLKEQNYIPSISFGYTAGAKYRFAGVYASLTLGGYDTSRFVENNVTFTFAGDNERDLVIAIQSITTPSTIQSSPTATELLPTPIFAFIDATVPQIWLPVEACRAFEQEFGLTYDNKTQLYLVNNTLHDTLLDRNANVTFTIAQGLDGGPTVQIVLPYAAFNLQAQSPYRGLSNTSWYFPLRRAQNETQYTVGRTFLQEAYITVGYESAEFNVSQVAWLQSPEQNLVPILPGKESGSQTGSDNSHENSASSGLSGGALAGIVVGAIAAIAVVATVVTFLIRRMRKVGKQRDGEKLNTTAATAVLDRTPSRHVYPKAELEGSTIADIEHRRLLSAHGSMTPGTPRSIPGPGYLMYVNGGSSPTTPGGGEGTRSSTNSGQPFTPLSAAASEADSRERRVFEMPGDMPAVGEKDGKALTEKEAIARRERIYNGVDATPTSATDSNEGVREPRRVNPEDIVRTDGMAAEPRDRTLHRTFSFEEVTEQVR